MIVGVRQQHVAQGIHGNTHRRIEGGAGGGASIGRASRRRPVAGQRSHGAVAADLAYAFGTAVGDEEVAVGIEGQRRRLEELRQGGRPAIADGMHVAIARSCGDVARHVYTPHPHAVGNPQVAADVRRSGRSPY